MKILSTPVYISSEEITEVALYTKSTYEQVSEIANRMQIVSPESHAYLRRIAGQDSNIYKKIIINNKTAGIKDQLTNMLYLTYDPEFSRIAVFLSEFFDHSILANHCEYFRSNQKALRRVAEAIIERKRQESFIRTNIQGIILYEPIDFRELEKYCRKYKIKFSLNEDKTFDFEFRSVKIGNETEGHVNYKIIILTFDEQFNIIRQRYYFKSWYYDTKWNLKWAMHPHVGGYICYGNRAEDMDFYIAQHQYAFIVDLIKETVHSYYPEKPFISIQGLSTRLLRMENALPKAKAALEKFNSSPSMEEIIPFIAGNSQVCSVCGYYIYENHCTNPNCTSHTTTATTAPVTVELPTVDTEIVFVADAAIRGDNPVVLSDEMIDIIRETELEAERQSDTENTTQNNQSNEE